MASAGDIFYFGTEHPAHLSLVQSPAAPQAGFAYRMNQPAHQPAMNPLPAHPEDDVDAPPDAGDSELEDGQAGGVLIAAAVADILPSFPLAALGPQPLPPQPQPSASSGAHGSTGEIASDETDATESGWEPPYTWPQGVAVPGGMLHMVNAGASANPPPYIPMNLHPASFSLGNSQFAIPPYWEDSEVNTPSVDDYTFKPDVCKFMETWRVAGGIPAYGMSRVGPEASKVKHWERPQSIGREELQGNRYDIQGIDWDKLETTREKAREARTKLYLASISRTGPVPSRVARKLPSTENYFRFRRVNTNHQALIAHFQLRNLISATSRNDIYYAGRSRVMRTDSLGRATSCVMDLTRSHFDSLHSATFDITSMTASDNILIAGGFHGEYALVDLQSEHGSKPTQGFITHEPNGITNHVHTFSSRSAGSTMAAFSSNDKRLRVLDCHTNRFVYDFGYDDAINCAATSPNGRLRMVVGDFAETLITDAETGRPFERLRAHDDHTFACAWADDGIHIATGAQDSQIVVYDARWWRRPLAVVASVMACPRSLHFSPVGGGERVLLAAEADDVVSVVDAQRFDRAQTLDFFGTVSGVGFTPDGASFFVANSDAKFGGIMEFERAGWGGRFGVCADGAEAERRGDVDGGDGVGVGSMAQDDGPLEWADEMELDGDRRVRLTAKARRRRGLALGELVV